MKDFSHQLNFRLKRTAKFISLLLAVALGLSCSRQPQPRPTTTLPSTVPAGSQILNGRVVHVADGDTITVLDATNTQHRIRLEGIDAPESHQAFGAQSKKSLSEMVFGREVSVVVRKTDQYGRLVGKILLDGRDINLEQVKAGLAWHYKEYQREQTLADRELYARFEDEAHAARRGLWQDPDPIEPSAFRKEEKRDRQEAR